MQAEGNIPIYIPTKNRSEKQNSYKIFTELGLKPILVVEPQEAEKYTNYRHIILPDNNRGMSFARNRINEYARAKNQTFIVQADDDIIGFYKKNDNGKIQKDNTAFLEALEVFKKQKMCGGMERQHYAWTKNEDIIYLKPFSSLQFLYLPHLEHLKFYEDEQIIEDMDMFLQLCFAGHNTFRTIKQSFCTPAVGSNAGGLQEWYKAGGNIEGYKNLQRRWKGFFRFEIKKGKIIEKFNYKELRGLIQ